MELKVTIDAKAFTDAMRKFSAETKTEVVLELNNSCLNIQKNAMATHRYKSKSGNLMRSCHYKVNKAAMRAEVALDSSGPASKYAPSIHNGSDPHRIYAKNKKALYFVMGKTTKVMVPKNPHKVPGWMIKSGMIGGKNTWGKGGKKSDGITWSQKGYVDHPGTQPDPFLYNAAKKEEPIFSFRINSAIFRVISALGLR